MSPGGYMILAYALGSAVLWGYVLRLWFRFVLQARKLAAGAKQVE